MHVNTLSHNLFVTGSGFDMATNIMYHNEQCANLDFKVEAHSVGHSTHALQS